MQERWGRVSSAVAATDTRARQHSATRFGFLKPIQTESNLFQTYSKFSKFWLIQKVAFRALKIGYKIWLERVWDEEQHCLKNSP
jgi:hypothetical protein